MFNNLINYHIYYVKNNAYIKMINNTNLYKKNTTIIKLK